MADNNSELLALMGDLLRATDRQTEENKRAIQEMWERLERKVDEISDKFEHILIRFATATADGFIRVEQKIDGVKQEVTELRQGVQRIDQRLEWVEKALPGYEDLVRRLIILENIVLPKAS